VSGQPAPSLAVEHLSKVYRLGPGVFAPLFHALGRISTPHDGAAGDAPAERRAGRRREVRALDDVSFSIPPGTILGVIGPNGAGKSTLLKIIARVTPPTGGRVVGRGRVVSLLEMGVGFQPTLSGRQNVFLTAAIYGINRAAVAKRLDAIMAFAELEEFADVPVSRYSSGMYVRLAFSVAVHMDPDILLADEVLAVGDLAFQERCLERARRERAAGRTILFVSHDMTTITRICDRVLWLNAGRSVDLGDPDDIVSRYQTAAWTNRSSERAGDGAWAGEHARLVDVRLTDGDGREVSTVNAAHDVFVRIEFEVLTPSTTVRPRFSLHVRDVVVLQTELPEDATVTRPGLYTTLTRIPEDLLADGIYSVGLTLPVEHEGEVHLLKQPNALSFRVYNTRTGLRGLSSERKKGFPAGVVDPPLEWTLR